MKDEHGEYCPICCNNVCDCDEGDWPFSARDRVHQQYEEIQSLKRRLAAVAAARDEACVALENLAHRYERGEQYATAIGIYRGIGKDVT